MATPRQQRWSLIVFSIVILLLTQAACTSVAIYGADVKERVYPGVVVLEIHPKATEVAAVSTRGFGLTFGTKSMTLGYLREFSVFAQKDATCKAILLVEDVGNSDALQFELNKHNFGALCVPDKRGKP